MRAHQWDDEEACMNKALTLGGGLLIVLGTLHAVHVALAADVEPYLWAASLFLIAQGILTLVFMRKNQR